jgi:DNA segregation ATPase FtsK/SpoIIIE-like protein
VKDRRCSESRFAKLPMLKRLTRTAAMIGAVIVSMTFAPEAAFADKRVALVVGNSSYQTVPQLPNPSRDASAVAKMLRDAGFDTVDVQLNVENLEFKRAIRKFEADADRADIAVVYYAGHGLEIAGTNYLIPVDARLASDRDADDEAISLERLVSSADGAKRLRLIIVDACRDNPFVTTMRRERKTASRGVAGGLGWVEPTSTDTLIAYAAKAGSTANDGDGLHSPFTAAILKNLTVPGLDVRLAFGRVRDEVLKETSNQQEPFVYGSLGGGNVSLVPAPVVPQEAPVSDIKADYELVQQINTKRGWEVFLASHPTGFYADLARARIEQLNAQPASQPNATVASLAPQQPPAISESASKEAIAWDKIKDSTEIRVLQRFIRRFPNAPLALNARQRIDVLNRAAQEREEKARAEREAARQAAEEARRKAEQQKAELAAQKKREEEERRAREAEAAEKARTAAAELAATKKREEEERQAAAAEAARQAKAAEAERKAQEAKQKAEQAEREKAAAEAAARAAAEQKAKEAEAAEKARAAAAEAAR